MVPPKKKPSSARVSSTQKSYGGGVGISIQQVQAVSQQHFLKRQQERAAQERLYQQITRSARPYTNAPMPQDGAIAYHAQALTRALLKRQAIDNGHARLVRQGQANQTYISQGENLTPGQIKERRRRTELIISRRKYEEHIRAVNSPEIANSILHDVVLQNVAQAGLVVVGPELAAFRLPKLVEAIGGVKAAATATRIASAYTYPAINLGKLTWGVAGQAGKTFLARSFTDAGLQYAGASVMNANKQMNETGDVNFNRLVIESTGGINATSVILAGLPGNMMRHSFRNALIGNAFEVNRDPETGWGYKHVDLTLNSSLNYAQKVGLSVGADYLAGRFSASLLPYQGGGKAAILRSTDENFIWLYRHRLSLLTNLSVGAESGIKVTGGVMSGAIQDNYLMPPTDE